MEFLSAQKMNRKRYLLSWFAFLLVAGQLSKINSAYNWLFYLMAMLSIGEITIKRCNNAGVRGLKKYIPF